MRRTLVPLVPLVPLVLAAAAVPSGAAPDRLAAAVAVGAIPGGATAINGCDELTAVQQSSNPQSYDIPDRGVLTSWRFRGNTSAGDALVRALVFRPTGGDQWLVAQRTAEAVASANSVLNVPTRLRVREGDQLGLRIVPGSNTPGCWYSGAAGDGFKFEFAADPVGGDTFAPPNTVPDGRLDITATWEPDGDNDGFGDVTQDRCLTQASGGASCDRRAPRPGSPTSLPPRPVSARRSCGSPAPRRARRSAAAWTAAPSGAAPRR